MTKLDITSTVLEKTVDLVKGFVERIAGSSLDEAGLMLSDNIKLRRFKNQITIWSKAQKIAEENGINPKQLNLKVLVPLLEFTSLEEEETLQDKWANLLVNFIDTTQNYESTVFPYILSQTTSNEIMEIDRLYLHRTTSAMHLELAGVDSSNLVRLGLIEIYAPNKVYLYAAGESPKKHYSITKLGKRFVECCSPRETNKPL